MGSIPSFASTEWGGWATIRHALTARRQAGSLDTFHFGMEPAAHSVWPLTARRIHVTDQRIWLNGLPEAFRGFRILQLSDMHHSRYVPLERAERMVEMANRLRPDLVALTGDFVSYSRASIEPIARVLGGLYARSGVVAVLGNHDFRVDARAIERALSARGIEVLRNRHFLLRKRGSVLAIAGVDDYHYGADPERALAGIPEGVTSVLLAHNPRQLGSLVERGVGLVLSGHTHGGQVNLPLLGTIYGRSPEKLRYKIGWDRMGDTQIYVSRGIGTIVLPWRLRCPAEMPWLELMPHQPAADTIAN
jgi:predicted MPP superfamily phosphohydrolase